MYVGEQTLSDRLAMLRPRFHAVSGREQQIHCVPVGGDA
jgi:hypothetical protein